MTDSPASQIIDNALSLAVSHLVDMGLPKDEAQIALLVRLWSCVPEEVAEIANILREDPQLLTAMSNNSVDQSTTL